MANIQPSSDRATPSACSNVLHVENDSDGYPQSSESGSGGDNSHPTGDSRGSSGSGGDNPQHTGDNRSSSGSGGDNSHFTGDSRGSSGCGGDNSHPTDNRGSSVNVTSHGRRRGSATGELGVINERDENGGGSSSINTLDVANGDNGSSSRSCTSSGSASSDESLQKAYRQRRDGVQGVEVVNGSEASSVSGSGRTLEFPPQTDFFVDTKTLEKANPNWLHGPRVLYSLVDTRDTGMSCGKFPANLLEELQKNHDQRRRADLSKLVQNKLYDLKERKQFRDVALFLGVHVHKSLAISSLEHMLLDLLNSQDISVREELIEVAKSSQDAFLKLCEDDANLLPMTSLHVMALSAVLSRCPQPSLEQCQALAISKKDMKKKSCGGQKQQMMKALQLFHEEMKDDLDKAFIQHWSHADFSEKERTKRKDDFARASFCQLMVHIFTILNELKYQGRNEHGSNLLTTLLDLYSSTKSARKHKIGDEAKALMDFCILRGMVVLLKTTFEGEDSQVGTRRSKHNKSITDLIQIVIEGANTSYKPSLVREIESLPFHISTHVRKIFNDFFEAEGVPLHDIVQGYMMTNLHSIGFHRHRSIKSDQSPDLHQAREACGWQTATVTVGQRQGEVAMYTPTARCMSGAVLEKCSAQHPGLNEKDEEGRRAIKERAEKHKRNLGLLRDLSPKCSHLLKLYSYQLLPFPFYVTEEVENHRLIAYLLDHRDSQLWLSDAVLRNLTVQVVEALEFLTSHNIDPREVTCYNLVVQPGTENRRQSLGKRCSVLTSSNCVVKLADLGLAHEFLSKDPIYDDKEIKHVRSQGAVPLRWTSPEALFEGRYGEKNMVYSAGCVMYELWTHGCQPFTSYDHTMTTEDILTKMFTDPGSMQLARRPCMPTDVYSLVSKCTQHDPNKRPSLLELKRDLLGLDSAKRQDMQEPGVEGALSMKMKYPQVSDNQTSRYHIPESGIPKSIQELIDAGKRSELYNRKRSSIRVHAKHTVVTDAELEPTDRINILHLRREYPPSVTLKTAALEGLLFNPGDENDDYEDDPLEPAFLEPFVSLARTMLSLHEKGWIMRDLKEDNILIDCENGSVILPRIGRMHRLTSTETFMVDDVFEDSRRWLAPEVLTSGQYGKENDIFMLGTVILQFFRIIEKKMVARNPSPLADRDFAPWCNVEKHKVADYIRDQSREENRPELCPEWLYTLTVKCRHPDPAQRPSAKDVTDTLEEHWTSDAMYTPFIPFPENGEARNVTATRTSPIAEPKQATSGRKKKRAWTTLRTAGSRKGNVFKNIRDRITRRKRSDEKRMAPRVASLPASYFDLDQTLPKSIAVGKRSVRFCADTRRNVFFDNNRLEPNDDDDNTYHDFSSDFSGQAAQSLPSTTQLADDLYGSHDIYDVTQRINLRAKGPTQGRTAVSSLAQRPKRTVPDTQCQTSSDSAGKTANGRTRSATVGARLNQITDGNAENLHLYQRTRTKHPFQQQSQHGDSLNSKRVKQKSRKKGTGKTTRRNKSYDRIAPCPAPTPTKKRVPDASNEGNQFNGNAAEKADSSTECQPVIRAEEHTRLEIPRNSGNAVTGIRCNSGGDDEFSAQRWSSKPPDTVQHCPKLHKAPAPNSAPLPPCRTNLIWQLSSTMPPGPSGATGMTQEQTDTDTESFYNEILDESSCVGRGSEWHNDEDPSSGGYLHPVSQSQIRQGMREPERNTERAETHVFDSVADEQQTLLQQKCSVHADPFIRTDVDVYEIPDDDNKQENYRDARSSSKVLCAGTVNPSLPPSLGNVPRQTSQRSDVHVQLVCANEDQATGGLEDGISTQMLQREPQFPSEVQQIEISSPATQNAHHTDQDDSESMNEFVDDESTTGDSMAGYELPEPFSDNIYDSLHNEGENNVWNTVPYCVG